MTTIAIDNNFEDFEGVVIATLSILLLLGRQRDQLRLPDRLEVHVVVLVNLLEFLLIGLADKQRPALRHHVKVLVGRLYTDRVKHLEARLDGNDDLDLVLAPARLVQFEVRPLASSEDLREAVVLAALLRCGFTSNANHVASALSGSTNGTRSSILGLTKLVNAS